MKTTSRNATPARTASILAIDLGKYKSVLCVHDRSDGSDRFETVATTRHELINRLERLRPEVVLIEACALSGWVHDLCRARCAVRSGQHGERGLEVQTHETKDGPG